MSGHIRWLGGLLFLGVSILHAKDFPTQRMGDVVGADIVTPVALEVIDPAATAALRSVEALKTPAIFRSYPAVTNALAHQFEITFESTRSNFVSALQDSFHQIPLDHATIMSPDFGYLLTAFNIKNKNFPIPGFLAMDWAYGKTGAVEKERLFNALWRQMQSPVRPDDLPAGFELGPTARVVSVTHADERLTLGEAIKRGQFISQTNLITVAQARVQFRREFTSDDEQPLTRALAAWLQPDCLPDAVLTKIARDRAVSQLVVAEHYTAGQVIAPQGSVIDTKIKAALDALAGKSTADQPLTVISGNEANDSAAAFNHDLSPKNALGIFSASQDAPRSHETTKGWTKAITRQNAWIAGISFAAILGLIAGWRWLLHRRHIRQVASVTKDLPWQAPAGLQTELAPQLVHAVQSAFVQELAGQRRHLLVTQQAAATEVIRLVHKMDELQIAMQERLQTYESQIHELETELAARTEENRELIQLKIQLIRHQLDVETSRRQVQFN